MFSMSNQYTVINASAGSGKTYTLVQRLLLICLRYPNQPDAIRSILALTFTNKAANEMKQRILSWLRDFVKDDYASNVQLKGIQQKLKEEGITVSLQDLHERSVHVLDYILHHYSTLNISTIDKFNSRLVRSFAYELGLPQNFNLEIQAEPFLIEAVDKMLDEIGENEQISEAFMDYVNYNLDNNEKVALSNTLYDSAKEFVQDKHYFELLENKNFSWEAYENAKEKIRTELSELAKTQKQLIENSIKLMTDRNLEPSDFAGGNQSGIGKFFYEVKKYYQKERGDFLLPENNESAVARFRKGVSGTGKGKELDVDEIIELLIENREQLIKNYITNERKTKILKALLPLKVNKEIQDKLGEIEDENDLVLLSKFNVLIHENLREEPSAFIYEKVGTQFQHYFFDEFQDTSSIQWQNFLPLRDHTITSEHTSFTIVGDPKQSIYRFRGGESQMMLDIIHHNELTPIYATVENLDTNWRSSKNIINFNNQFYEFLSSYVSKEHQDIFGKGSFQNASAEFPGRVRVNLLENQKKAELFENTAEKMKLDIQDCLDKGFDFSDITILCRGNYDIFMYSQLLGKEKVLYKGNEIYIKTISEKGLTLDLSATLLAVIEFLRWEINPKNYRFLTKMMYYLNTSGKIKIENFSQTILDLVELKNKEDIEKSLFEKFGIQLAQLDIPHLNLYNFIEYYVQTFSIDGKETDYILNFLETVYNYSQNAGFTIKDFVKFWDEEGKKISIQTSENIDAIQLMTIHKSKGLEFPVVLLPMENSNKDANFRGWISAEENDIQSVIVEPFSGKLPSYDEEMQTFNEIHQYQNRIDRYCLLYVATTRAVEHLYLYLEKATKGSKSKEGTNHLEILTFVEKIQSDLFRETEEKPDSFDIFPTEENLLSKQKFKEKQNLQTRPIEHIATHLESKSAITIATPSKNYQQRNEKVRNGIFTHEILSKIKTSGDVDFVLRNYLMEGSITTDELIDIRENLIAVLEDKRYASYFKEGLKIINEKEIMISDASSSQIYRPDRLVETPEGIVILDFKTGEEKDKDKQQIEDYKNALEQIGKTVVAAELIYL